MKLKTHMVEKPWGRDDIADVFHAPPAKKIGEIWYDDGADDPLPLLIKWLFTSENLSIQVHPDDAQARACGLTSGKEECWYIVDAQPGAVLGIGSKIPLGSDDLRRASLDGSIEQLIDWKPVRAGDYFYIPAGTIHAIGAGITLVEVQQYADVTYRLYDYGRPRELHLDDGVAVAKAVPYADPRSGHAISGKSLADSRYFRLWLADSAAMLATLPDDATRWIVPLSGRVTAGKEHACFGECLLVEQGVTLNLSDDARCLIAMV